MEVKGLKTRGAQKMGRRPKQWKLEPVLEDSHMCHSVSESRPRMKATKRSKSQKGGKPTGSLLMNPLSVLEKLRDWYVNKMNEFAAGGEMAGLAHYSGFCPGQDYPGAREHEMAKEDREREAILQQLNLVEQERQRQETLVF